MKTNEAWVCTRRTVRGPCGYECGLSRNGRSCSCDVTVDAERALTADAGRPGNGPGESRNGFEQRMAPLSRVRWLVRSSLIVCTPVGRSVRRVEVRGFFLRAHFERLRRLSVVTLARH